MTWSSNKQPTVALSSTKAKYRGAAIVACKVAWLHKLLGDFGLQVHKKVVIYCDNLSSIQLAHNPVFYAWTKHIEVHYHIIREKVLSSDIDLVYVNTEEQVADIFTKALGAEKLQRFRVMLGVQELDLSSRGSVEMSSSTYVSTHGTPTFTPPTYGAGLTVGLHRRVYLPRVMALWPTHSLSGFTLDRCT